MTLPPSTNSLINSIITDIAIPELLSFIRDRHANTGELPTDDEVIAHFHRNVADGIAESDAFLRLKGHPTGSSPAPTAPPIGPPSDG